MASAPLAGEVVRAHAIRVYEYLELQTFAVVVDHWKINGQTEEAFGTIRARLLEQDLSQDLRAALVAAQT